PGSDLLADVEAGKSVSRAQQEPVAEWGIGAGPAEPKRIGEQCEGFRYQQRDACAGRAIALVHFRIEPAVHVLLLVAFIHAEGQPERSCRFCIRSQSATPMTEDGTYLDDPVVAVRNVVAYLEQLLGKKRMVDFDVHPVGTLGEKRRALAARHHHQKRARSVPDILDRLAK